MPADPKTVVLASPCYGGLSPMAARAVYRASARPDLYKVRVATQDNSLLAHCFNIMWCGALNLAKAEPVDYFAMIHNDQEPEAGWLDVLIEELEAKSLDVLGVAVAIKDQRGLTSTAVARDDGDTYRTHCRLTTTEVHRLPETFTSDDIGGKKLLLNTGLWVCKFDPAWASKVHFEINDRIVVGEDGKYHAQVEPEDWHFSRLLHEQGLKIGCTRKLLVGHRGQAVYPNTPFGRWPFDHSHLTESILGPDTTPTPSGA